MYLDRQRDIATTVGLLEREFWRMSPGELNERWDIFQRREEREWERAAWMVHHITAAFVGGKNALTVDELLGRVTDA